MPPLQGPGQFMKERGRLVRVFRLEGSRGRGVRAPLARFMNWRWSQASGQIEVVFRPRPFYAPLKMLKTFAESNFPGRLIAVEGLDGSGKSTQIYLLKRWLELQKLKVYFSEWNSSELVKAATSKGKKRELLSPTTFSLIYATAIFLRPSRAILCGGVRPNGCGGFMISPPFRM